MNQNYICQYKNHEKDPIIGFCFKIDCTEISPLICSQCLFQKHMSHIKDCYSFYEIKQFIKKSKNELDILQQTTDDVKINFDLQPKIKKILIMVQIIELQNKKFDGLSQYVEQEISQQGLIAKLNSFLKSYKILDIILNDDYLKIMELKPQPKITDQTKAEQCDAFFYAGKRYYEEGLFTQALECFEQLQKIDPQNQYVYLYKDRILNKQDQYKQALKSYDEELAINNCKAPNIKGSLHKQQEDQQALTSFESAQQKDQLNSVPQRNFQTPFSVQVIPEKQIINRSYQKETKYHYTQAEQLYQENLIGHHEEIGQPSQKNSIYNQNSIAQQQPGTQIEMISSNTQTAKFQDQIDANIDHKVSEENCFLLSKIQLSRLFGKFYTTMEKILCKNLHLEGTCIWNNQLSRRETILHNFIKLATLLKAQDKYNQAVAQFDQAYEEKNSLTLETIRKFEEALNSYEDAFRLFNSIFQTKFSLFESLQNYESMKFLQNHFQPHLMWVYRYKGFNLCQKKSQSLNCIQNSNSLGNLNLLKYYNAAIGFYDNALSCKSKFHNASMRDGNLLLEINGNEKAKQFLDKNIQRNHQDCQNKAGIVGSIPTFPSNQYGNHLNLRILMKQFQTKQQQCYERAINNNPGFLYLMNNKSNHYFNLENILVFIFWLKFFLLQKETFYEKEIDSRYIFDNLKYQCQSF